MLSQTVVQCHLSPGVTRDHSPWLRIHSRCYSLLESLGLWEVEQILDNSKSISLIKEVQQMALAGLISHPWGRVVTRTLSQVPTPAHWNSQAGGNFLLK